MPTIATQELNDLLLQLGRRWAMSPRRLRPDPKILDAWDEFLNAWKNSEVPLLFRRGYQRKIEIKHSTGRRIVFADNGPAHWAFNQALRGAVPSLNEGFFKTIPLAFTGSSSNDKHTINKDGWKLCHIDAVSDRRRYPIDKAPIDWIEKHFIRFLSPRNMFVIPKTISGAGELPTVISAIREFESIPQKA